MKRIYTKTGDQGMTHIRGGIQVPKDDIRIEANGTLDELNAVIGIVRSLLPEAHPWQTLLSDIQQELLIIMSHIATPEGKINTKPLHAAELTSRFEQEMDIMLSKSGAPSGFITPNGTQVVAQLHFARTVARRAERRLWTFHRQQAIADEIPCFMNRLSDLLFVIEYQKQQKT